MTQTMATRKLNAPPIIEVVCGVFFPAVAGVDPVLVGGWWHQIQKQYPRHEIQPAVADGSILFSHGVGPLRSWLISEDDEWVIQIQPDRFYMNWRKRGGGYPRFSGKGGVLDRVMLEFGRFKEYCLVELKVAISPVFVDLAKVDLIVEEERWRGPEDLGKVLPIIADVGRFAKSGGVEVNLQIAEPRPEQGGAMHLGLSLSTESVRGGQVARVVKIDTRCTRRLAGPSDDQVRRTLGELNDEVNAAFFGLINPDELHRFDGARGPA
jgi:uncharacterized protein (TIGR04255 family)